MDPVMVGLIGIALLVVFIFSGVPVGITMGLIGFGGLIGINGLNKALANNEQGLKVNA